MCLPRGDSVISAIKCIIRGDHGQLNDGGLHECCRDLELSYGAVTTAVCVNGQVSCNVERQAYVPESQTLLQDPENATQGPLAHVVCAMPCGRQRYHF